VLYVIVLSDTTVHHVSSNVTVYCLGAVQLSVIDQSFIHSQLHVKFAVLLVTDVCVHFVHRFVVGAVSVGVLFAVQHSQFIGVAVISDVQFDVVHTGCHVHSQSQFTGDHSVGKFGVVGFDIHVVQNVSAE
jgi:hypothetical protein